MRFVELTLFMPLHSEIFRHKESQRGSGVVVGFLKDVPADLADPKMVAASLQPLLANLENEALQSGRVALLFSVSLANRRTTIREPAGESLCAPLRSGRTLSWGRILIEPHDRAAASRSVCTYGT